VQDAQSRAVAQELPPRGARLQQVWVQGIQAEGGHSYRGEEEEGAALRGGRERVLSERGGRRAHSKDVDVNKHTQRYNGQGFLER